MAVLAATMMALTFGSSAPANDGLLDLSCGYEASHPFLPWLDPSPYTLIPDGGFEGGAKGWKLKDGAKVVSGNEPYYVAGPGAHSLYLPPGSSATSPSMCVQLVLPTVRFMSVGGSLFTYLKVEVLYRDAAGKQRAVELLPGATPTSRWQPTLPLLQLGGALSLLTLDGVTTEMQFRFTPTGVLGGGKWRIDNVFVDPWKDFL
ncbi:MAG TPA: hypothetical protein VNT23_08715 [Gaiellaceae bacterium]|nr:hypothetical protein [Gaiellaceae bacterium]